MIKFTSYVMVLALAFAPMLAVAGTSTAPVDIQSALPAGSAVVGKVGIDQTTPGTTNAVQVTNPFGLDATLTGGTQKARMLDSTGTALTSTNNAGKQSLDVNIAAGSVGVSTIPALVAGSAIVGKVGIDQTTPGTTNLVSIGTNGTVAIGTALPAGSAIIGKTGIDQTTPGTTNAVSVSQIGATTVSTGNGVAGAGVQRVVIASDQTAFPVTTTTAFSTRADTFTTASNGTTVNVSTGPLKSFALGVKATGAVTSWTVVLECSLDNTNFTTVLTHTNTSPGDGQIIFAGTNLAPCLYFRTRTSAITLGGGTNVVATILGM